MGPGEKQNHESYKTHQAYFENIRSGFDVALIENVPQYSETIVKTELGDEWDTTSLVIDPRIFGVPCARTRLYVIAWRKGKVSWRGGVDVLDILDTLAARVTTSAKSCFWMDLPSSSLTPSQEIVSMMALQKSLIGSDPTLENLFGFQNHDNETTLSLK